MVEAMVNQIEQGTGVETRVGLEALIETALGMANVETIAQFGGRLECLHFGVADYAASMRARTVNIGGLNPDYPGDQWHASITRMVIACRAYGLRAVDGPFGDFSDPEGYKAAARRAAALGCEGKWAIHPSQIALANEVFSPPEAEVTKAERIIEELRKAEAEGRGAASLDGKMIDAASEKMAKNVIDMAKAIVAKSEGASA
jgi:citrate lyase subunit beta/citryl-CoA lyase